MKLPKDMTAQEVFDTVATHLLTQNEKSLANPKEEACLYRAGDLKCAAGCLIPDELYSPEMEGCRWRILTYHYPIFVSQHTELIRRLQVIHDEFVPSKWQHHLLQVAGEFRLNSDCLDKFKDGVV